MYCSKCGVEQLEGSKFCHECGCKIISEDEQKDNTNHGNERNSNIDNINKWGVKNRKKLLIGLGTVIIVAVLAIIGKYGIYDNTTQGKLKKVVKLNLKAMEDEDVEKYMSTLDTETPYLLRDQLKSLFQMYDLKYTIEDMKVLSTDNKDAQVQVVQVTKKIQGPQFNNNKSTIIHHLRKKDGVWKIYDSDFKDSKHVK